ncbi:integral membrane sensor hybrid histidine kinase [Desulfovibrio sp. X2]|uniref:hybrid sensor histidine kinase/response regulator n=1 Tax=Desulfovibrio sp. X2 TaxID=941449 RepID=UPI000358D7DD|nr:ATP-binding protein [Desulfovibrio sp. X2]EPR43383.1 integral membrane sensor hybrid histidine kinase [Desulfovibrio sp. X2]
MPDDSLPDEAERGGGDKSAAPSDGDSDPQGQSSARRVPRVLAREPQPRGSVRRAVLLPLAAALALIVALGSTGAWFLLGREAAREAQATRDLALREMRRRISSEARRLFGFIDFLTARDDLARALEVTDRVRLLALAGGDFARLRATQGLDRFLILDAERRVVWRLHEPARMGDVRLHDPVLALDGGAVSGRGLFDAGGRAAGLEVSPAGRLALYAAAPVVRQGRVLGYIELGADMGGLLPSVAGLIGADLVLTVDKGLLDRPAWEHGAAERGFVQGWDELPREAVVQATLPALPDGLARALAASRAPRAAFLAPQEGTDYLAGVAPLGFLSGTSAGTTAETVAAEAAAPRARLAVLLDVTSRRAAARAFCLGLAAFGGLLGWLVFALFKRRIAGVERSLDEADAGLRREIGRRARIQDRLASATRAARAASRAKSDFLATMSHEMRTPLNGIIGFADLTLETPLTPEQGQNLRYVREAASSLLAVINDVLDLARADTGRLHLAFAPFDPRAVCAEVVELFGRKAAEKGLALGLHAGREVPAMVVGDAAHLRQILQNLVGNAVKFTAAGGVRLIVESSPASVPGRGPAREDVPAAAMRFTVEDSGPGIPERLHESIFSAFTQTEETLTRSHGGSGLGLALVRRLAGLMGGEVKLRSTPGHGSSFSLSLTLPLPPGPATDALAKNRAEPDGSREPGDAPDGARQRSLRVLVAEDSLVNQHLARRILQRLGHTAVVAPDGREALAHLREGGYDLALLDLNLPGLDGLALAGLVRRGDAGVPSLPLLAVSATPARLAEPRAREAGMDGYLEKPLSVERLAGAVEALLPPSGKS